VPRVATGRTTKGVLMIIIGLVLLIVAAVFGLDLIWKTTTRYAARTCSGRR